MNQPAGKVRYSAMGQLILARVREFWREPAAIFWVYVFPVLMMIALGVAFRNRPVEQVTAVIEQGDEAETIQAALGEDARFRVSIVPSVDAQQQLRTGRTDIVISVGEESDKSYTFSTILLVQAVSWHAIRQTMSCNERLVAQTLFLRMTSK